MEIAAFDGERLVVSTPERNLPFDECTEVFGSERLTGALLDRLSRMLSPDFRALMMASKVASTAVPAAVLEIPAASATAAIRSCLFMVGGPPS